ncbi:tail fiber protein [Cytobacillus sp. IB215665]|uniref:tail fiber protein n=1 Tax=Cytobacillus sp. IB215665 TaxID=3097357 RepID=UPI002A143D86|nr:tail fiber protein [Cytobacillus sp. IB215665]MDX8367863.1 tail fiber protein [Cytobacillus sp. IB215665]
MAEKYSFFDPIEDENGLPDREYNAQQFTNFFYALITTGVMKGFANELAVLANGANMITEVESGISFVEGRYYLNDSTIPLAHDTESLGKDRIDRIVVRLDENTDARYVKSFIKKGVASTDPVPPDLQQDETVYEISLAQVKVIGGQTYINPDDVTDERGTEDICPWAGSNILPNFDDEALSELVLSIGQPNGIAELNAVGKVPQEQLDISDPPDATTSVKGIVQLDNSITSTSTTKAATPNAVKQVNDKLIDSKVALGQNSIASASYGIAIGEDTNNISTAAVAIGKEASVVNSYGIAMGYKAYNQSPNGIAIGYLASASLGNYGIALGDNASTTSGSGIAIGKDANNSGDSGIAIGDKTINENKNSVAIGKSATNKHYYSVAIGDEARNEEYYSVAIGAKARVVKGFSLAIGYEAHTEDSFSFAIGNQSESLNNYVGMIGVPSNVIGVREIEVAGNFSVAGTKNFVIPHPHPNKKATHVIRHGAVESPTAGDTLYRYTIEALEDGQTVEMQLPDYFEHLNVNVDVWVNPHMHFGRAFGVVEGDKLKVTCEKAGTYKALVIGTRNDDNVQDWHIKGVEREIGESWLGETYIFEVQELKETTEFEEVLQ